ncbi:MAG: hypothetical protein V1906_01180, partial [Candidatus Woesearchaeota archaeon]
AMTFRNMSNLTVDNYPGGIAAPTVGGEICNPLNNTMGDRGINITFKLQIDTSTGARAMEDLWFAYAMAV